MKTLLIVLLFWTDSVLAQPAQIILLRHGEKPDDPAAEHLSARGRERADRLVRLLGKGSSLTTNAPIVALFATRISRHGRSQRTSETLAPLAHDLGLPVKEPYESDRFALLARDVVHTADYRGKTVVICWTHHEMATLAQALGVTPAPAPWKDKVYDRLWIIKPDLSGATLQEIPQRLLPGDSKH